MFRLSSSAFVTAALAMFVMSMDPANAAGTEKVELLNADFSKDEEGFYYSDDTFGTNKPAYASGRRWHAGGGSLGLWLGGKDDKEIWDMSGGWTRRVYVPRDAKNVWISFQYFVTLSASLDSNEFVRVLAQFGDHKLGNNDIVFTFQGKNDNKAQRSGLLTFRADLGPTNKGFYDLILGAFLNSKNAKDEKIDVWFDNVSVSAELLPPPPPQPKIDIFKADFSKDEEGFKFSKDLFGTNKPDYSTGRRWHAGGGSLGVWLGGMDDKEIWDMSGGWTRHITIPGDATNLHISFQYFVTLSAGMDSNEFVRVLAQFGNHKLGTNGVVSTFRANNGKAAQASGLLTFRADLVNVKRGSYDLRLGAFLNSKNAEDEKVDVWFDNVSVSTGVGVAPKPYSRFNLHARTPLGVTNEGWHFLPGDYNGDGKLDMYCIKKNGVKQTEVHVLDGSDGFKSYLLRTATRLGTTGDNYDFTLGDYNNDGILDLWAIKKYDTGTKKTEVHILNGANLFLSWLVNTGTALHPTGKDWEFHAADWNKDGTLDLIVIKKKGVVGTEVHALDGKRKFKNFNLHSRTALHKTGANWAFGVGDYNNDGTMDLYAFDKGKRGGKTEACVLDGGRKFNEFLLPPTPTALHYTNSNWAFGIGDWNRDSKDDIITVNMRHKNYTTFHFLSGA